MHGHEPDAADRILREALRRSDADRAAYLHEVCAGQPELQLEVERLLSSVTQAYDIGEEPTRPGTPDLGGDRYVIQELIGQGGMGQVYRAEDRQLGRIVAIKAIRPGRASTPEVMHRLAREARLAASLDHPFICKVHELIQLEDGQVFFVMEYVEGETLRAVLKKGPLELSNAVRVGREMAEALSFAHEHGLVHRDVKPANVMVTSHGHIKVMDFGIAKVLDVPGASTTTTFAQAGRVIGTPAYMSPEQAAGEPVDQRSDIFSFGVVFYQCLTGELPFEGTSVTEYRRHGSDRRPEAAAQARAGRVARDRAAVPREETGEPRRESRDGQEGPRHGRLVVAVIDVDADVHAAAATGAAAVGGGGGSDRGRCGCRVRGRQASSSR